MRDCNSKRRVLLYVGFIRQQESALCVLGEWLIFVSCQQVFFSFQFSWPQASGQHLMLLTLLPQRLLMVLYLAWHPSSQTY